MFAIFNIITQIEVHLTILNLLLMTYKERERERERGWNYFSSWECCLYFIHVWSL